MLSCCTLFKRTKVHAVWGTWKRAVSCLYRDTLRHSIRKWFLNLQQSEGGGERGSSALWYVAIKKLKNFHYLITFYSRWLSNMETVQWHRSSLWLIHCLLHDRILQVCSFTLGAQSSFTFNPQMVEQQNLAARTLCNCVIRGRFTLCLREREVSK